VSDIQKYDPTDPKGHLRLINERMDANNPLNGDITVNFFYSEMAGSDPDVMAKIADCLEKNLPFGLKCQRSRVIFIPHVYKAYWIWSDGDGGPVFTYKDKRDLISGVKMQYLSHKEFIGTAELVILAKIIFYEHALDNLEFFRNRLLSQPSLPPGPVEPGAVRILPCGTDGDKIPEPASGHTGPQLLPESIRDAKDVPEDEGEDPSRA